MKPIFSLLLAGSLIAGCKCYEEPCAEYPMPHVRLTGFDSVELSNVIVRRWDTAGFYTRLIDTSIRNLSAKGATGIAGLGNIYPWFGYNFEIVFPAIPRTVRLYNFRYRLQSQEVCPGWNVKEKSCENPLTTYMQEGRLMNYEDNAQGYIVIAR
jgi:hypothetical protein